MVMKTGVTIISSPVLFTISHHCAVGFEAGRLDETV